MNSSKLPENFIGRLKQIVPQSEWDQVISSFSKRRPSTFRANTLKITTEELAQKLTQLGFEYEQLPWFPDAFILKNKSQRELTETPLYMGGFIYIQNLSSMIPPLVLDPQPDEVILDITAAPGSKTTQMAAMMKNSGQIVANDRSRVRNFILKHNLETLSVTNVRVVQMMAQDLWKKFPGIFDRTLVDVPCSLEGRFFEENPKTYFNWSEKRIKTLSDYQKMILRSAVSATKPGGTIVYSTCTFAPEENEEVIQWLLEKEKGNVSLEQIKLDKFTFSKPLTEWEGKKFDPEISKAARILPTDNMEGFFVAKMRKL